MLTSKITKETAENVFQFDRDSLNHKITYDAVMKKTLCHHCPSS